MTVAAVASLSDVGRRRDNNEDSILVDDPVFAVADGVGGAAGGEVASRVALEAFAREAGAIVDAASAGDNAVHDAFDRAIQACHQAVADAQLREPGLAGMATTLTALIVLDDAGRVALGHVGDSRAYRINARGAQQLSDDHSVAAELLRGGRISADEAAAHPQRNVITRAVGADDDLHVDASIVTASPGDWLLLCSDGLTDLVDDRLIARLVNAASSPDDAVRTLIDAANKAGGTDNISVVLLQPLEDDGSSPVVDEPQLSATEISGEIELTPILTAPQRAASEQTMVEPPTASNDRGSSVALEPTPEDGGSWKGPLLAVVVVLLALAAGVVAWSQSYYVSSVHGGTIGIKHGFPFAGLNRTASETDVKLSDLPASDRERVNAHTIRSHSDANKVLGDIVADASQQGTTPPPPAPAPTTTTR